METFAVTDLHLAAYLSAKGFALVDVRWAGRRATFCFSGRSDRKQTTDAFYSGTGQVSAQAFVQALRTLKTRIYNSNE